MKGTSSPISIANVHSNLHVDNFPSFDFEPLNRVIFGAGTLARLGDVTAELGCKRVLLVTDPGLARTGHPQRAKEFLEAAGITSIVYDQVKENPNTRLIREGTSFAHEAKIDGLVAVGGGSAMDAAKGINFILTNGGKMADYKGHGKATRPMLPSVGVPTTSGTGSEAQSYALITDESSHLKMACGDRKAAFRTCILDPELTISQPKHITAITGIDAIAHALESFVCTKRNPISKAYSKLAWQYLSSNFTTVLNEPTNLEARSGMQLGAHFAGMAIENAMLGICHSCANPLTAHYGLAHGTAIGLLLPHVARFNAAQVAADYAELAQAAQFESSDALFQQLTQWIKEADQPIRLRDCGVSDTILPLLAEEANQQWTARFNPRAVTEIELLQVYEAAW
jgi:alcohol dehydrogenase